MFVPRPGPGLSDGIVPGHSDPLVETGKLQDARSSQVQEVDGLHEFDEREVAHRGGKYDPWCSKNLGDRATLSSWECMPDEFRSEQERTGSYVPRRDGNQ